MAVNPFVYACNKTNIRTAPSVTVNNKYVFVIIMNGQSAFFGAACDESGAVAVSCTSRGDATGVAMA